MSKNYLYYTQHETDAQDQPITALYVSPRHAFEQNLDARPPYDREDRVEMDRVKTELNLVEISPWVFESRTVIPPDIIRWMAHIDNRLRFGTTDKFARVMKEGY